MARRGRKHALLNVLKIAKKGSKVECWDGGGVIKLPCGNEIPFYHAQGVYFVKFIVDMPHESGCPSFTGPGKCFSSVSEKACKTLCDTA